MFKLGELVKTVLTGEWVMVIGTGGDRHYWVRLPDYREVLVKSFEIESIDSLKKWYCGKCFKYLEYDEVIHDSFTFTAYHDVRAGGCGEVVENPFYPEWPEGPEMIDEEGV